MLRWFALLIVVFIASAAFGQVPPPPAPSAATQAAVDHSQESFVIEKLHTSYRFENDGTGRREVHARIKVQSEAGVEQWGQLVVGYSSANERVEIPFVRVLKADGSTVTAPADAVEGHAQEPDSRRRHVRRRLDRHFVYRATAYVRPADSRVDLE